MTDPILPVLPEPYGCGILIQSQYEEDYVSHQDAYTEDQLEEVQLQAVRACAMACESAGQLEAARLIRARFGLT